MVSFDVKLLNKIKHNYSVEKVKSAIAKENLQSTVDNSGNTLLHYAAKGANVTVARYLIDSGSQVDVQNNDGKTPLILAVENYSSKDIVETLINAGACVFKQDRMGNNTLKIYGADNRIDGEIGEVLLRNCDLPSDNQKIMDIIYGYGWCKIISLRNADITRQMLELIYPGGTVEAFQFGDLKAALCIAAISADVKNVKLLLKYCSVNGNITKKDCQHTLFGLFHGDMSEYSNERIEILKILLERIDSLLSDEGTIEKSIGYLLRQGKKEAIEILMQRGLDLSLEVSPDASGITAGDSVVHSFARNKNPGVIELLHGKNLDVNVRNRFEETPLMVAAQSGNAGAVEFLLEAGADINATDYRGLTALWRAIQHCEADRKLQYRDCIQTLLERGANVQLANSYDDNDKKIIDILLEDYEYLVSDLVISHLALQKALGTPIKQSIYNGIISDDLFKKDFESSQQELTDKVYQSITLFNLLTDSDRKLEGYARHQEIHSKLKHFASKKCKSDYFNSILQKRISKTIHTVDLRKEVAYIICRMIKIDYERFPCIGDEIASYFDQEDMTNLLDTISQE